MEKVGIPGLFFRQIKKVDTRINTYYNIFTGNEMTASEIKKLLKKAGFEIIAGAKHDRNRFEYIKRSGHKLSARSR